MKLFFRHKDDTNPRPQEREHSIALTERNYFLLDDNDVPLKFRMPEELERMVDEICSYLDTSASDFIRQGCSSISTDAMTCWACWSASFRCLMSGGGW